MLYKDTFRLIRGWKRYYIILARWYNKSLKFGKYIEKFKIYNYQVMHNCKLISLMTNISASFVSPPPLTFNKLIIPLRSSKVKGWQPVYSVSFYSKHNTCIVCQSVPKTWIQLKPRHNISVLLNSTWHYLNQSSGN